MNLKKSKNIFRKQISKVYSYSKIYYECLWLNSFLNYNSINLVLDVGANSGQYALSLRRFGYKKKIISFEPGSEAYFKLIKNAKNDSKWNIYEKVGLGNKRKNIKLNISENSVSSSIKNIKKLHLINQPNSKYIKKEKTKIIKLDEVFRNFYKKNENIMLKIDTQGYEWEVLQGSKKSLRKINVIQLELSFEDLYQDQNNWLNILKFLENNDFKVFKIIDGFKNKKNGKVFQSDFFLVNKKLQK